jgi:hypothetical protein
MHVCVERIHPVGTVQGNFNPCFMMGFQNAAAHALSLDLFGALSMAELLWSNL